MADTLYAWYRFSSWVTSGVGSETYQLSDGTTWTPSASYTQADYSNIRTITLTDATQTKVSGRRTYTATFSHWEFSYSGTYTDWRNYISTSGASASINHTTEYKTSQSPYRPGLVYLKAHWTIAETEAPAEDYTVTTAANPVAGGATTGDGQYASGSTCTVTATPANGYAFVRWELSTGATSTSRSYRFTVTQDTTATAYFRQYTNMLLHGSSNTLLHGASGTLLHDA